VKYRKSLIFSKSDFLHTLNFQNAISSRYGSHGSESQISASRSVRKARFVCRLIKKSGEVPLKAHLFVIAAIVFAFSLANSFAEDRSDIPEGILWQYWVLQLANGQWYAMVQFYGIRFHRGL